MIRQQVGDGGEPDTCQRWMRLRLPLRGEDQRTRAWKMKVRVTFPLFLLSKYINCIRQRAKLEVRRFCAIKLMGKKNLKTALFKKGSLFTYESKQRESLVKLWQLSACYQRDAIVRQQSLGLVGKTTSFRKYSISPKQPKCFGHTTPYSAHTLILKVGKQMALFYTLPPWHVKMLQREVSQTDHVKNQTSPGVCQRENGWPLPLWPPDLLTRAPSLKRKEPGEKQVQEEGVDVGPRPARRGQGGGEAHKYAGRRAGVTDKCDLVGLHPTQR